MPSVTQLVALASTLAVLSPLAACGDGIKAGSTARIEVRDGSRVIPYDGDLQVAELSFLAIQNTGNATLTIDSIEVLSEPAGAFTAETVATPFEIAPGAKADLTIAYHADIARDAAALVRLHTNRTADGRSEFSFNVEPNAVSATLIAQPSTVDFQTVQAGQTHGKALQLANVGSADVAVTKFYLSGHAGFSLTIGDTTYQASAEAAADGITLPEPMTVAAGSAVSMQVNYTAQGTEGATGEINFISNDPTDTDGTKVPLYANVSAPCIHVTPQVVDFGGKAVGHESSITIDIESCGDRPLVVTDMAVTDDAGGLYRIDTSALGTDAITIQPTEKIQLPVLYLPAAIAQLSGSEPVRDIGKLTIHSDAIQDTFDVQLTGFGVDPSCPVAVITCSESEEVAVQTTLHCTASQSESPSGITRYKWTVAQPSGSASVFKPSDDQRDVQFETNIVGSYTLKLQVWDSYGNPSCSTAEHTVLVTAGEGIHVELVWNTPGDIVQSDEGEGLGSDIDLHFMAPQSSDWFDDTYDCYFGNPDPRWATGGNQRNPHLDRDDTDGAGPENLNLDEPANGSCYEIGAHYWNDWGYGASTATVRVYIYGTLRFHWDSVRLVTDDMWEVGQVCWPSGDTTAYGNGSPQIQHNFYGSGLSTSGCNGTCDYSFDYVFCPTDCP